MLVLTRKTEAAVIIVTPTGERIRVVVTSINGSVVRLGFEAAKDVSIKREEICLPISHSITLPKGA